MKHNLFCTLLVALGLTGPSIPLYSQGPIEYRPMAGLAPQPPDSRLNPATMFRAAEAKMAGGTFEPAAQALLAGAEKFTRNIFNVPSLQFQRAVTEHLLTGAQRGDVLIVEWSFHETFGNGLIVLTDTPYYSTYDLRLRGCQIRSTAELTAFFNAALLPGRIRGPAGEKASAKLPATVVYLPANLPEITFFSGDTPSTSPYNFVADFKFSGARVGREWFVDFGVGKSGSQSFYGVPPWVPERFPALPEAVKSWTSTQVRTEVGQPVKPFEGGPDFTHQRDEILIAELARRGLSEGQVLDLLTDVQPTPDGYDLRLVSMIAGIRDSGTTSFTSRSFAPALKMYEGLGPVADKSVTTLFRTAAEQDCTADVEARAVDVLKKGIFAAGPLAYLGICSTSHETVATLQSITLATEALEKQKERTISEIRRNIDHPLKRHNTVRGNK